MFRFDRHFALKKADGLLLYIPVNMKPKFREDFFKNLFKKGKYKWVWVECKLHINSASKKIMSTKLCYNPSVTFFVDFLEQFALKNHNEILCLSR